jgi:low affinity Fe/Cu permease
MKKKGSTVKQKFNAFSTWVTKATGTPGAFFLAILVILVWAVTGPIFNFSEVWQLVINTGTTIITFLMMFVIQQSQNKDTLALHLKLNELIAANEATSNRLIDSEDLTDEELEVIKKYYRRLSAKTQKANSLFSTHSVDEAAHDAAEKDKKTVNRKKVNRNQKKERI